MLKDYYPYYLAGRAEAPNRDLEVTNKYTGEVATRVARADRAALERAIEAAAAAAAPLAKLPAFRRKEVLAHCVDRCRERAEELAVALCIEAGKPIQFARGEVTRLIDTFSIAAEEAVRIGGEVLPMDISERGAAYRGMWKRVAAGPCAFITPWNFPLNLVAHKVAPAIACGCPFVLKPASATPVGALIVGEILAETDLPPGSFSILPLASREADPLVEDERIRKLSFTGSHEVGWGLRDRAKKKHVTLELGGNAACIVDADADIADAVERILFGAFYQSGQSCISVQRIYAHQSLYERFRDQLVAAAKRLKVGDPRDEETFIGPIISVADAERIEQTIRGAVDAGATLLCGGQRDGAMITPAILENVPAKNPASCEEIFGPVALLESFTDYQDALRGVNDSRYGIQAGVFTPSLSHALQAWDELQTGAVLINDVPSFRLDHMPYGGVKESGLGREGIRWAIESMTEVKLLVLRER